MQGKRVIESLKLSDFLSFGSQAQEIELQPLNVLIGPNASGKSNFIEAFRILNAAPEDVSKPMREGGGVDEYLWKGDGTPSYAKLAEIGVKVSGEPDQVSLFYSLAFLSAGSQFDLAGEKIQFILAKNDLSKPEFIYHPIHTAQAELYSKQVIPSESDAANPETQYVRNIVRINRRQSILSQYKDPNSYPALTQLQKVFSEIHFYTGWNLGRYSPLRFPQRPDLPSTTLLEDGSNLGLILINQPGSVRQEITERLKVVLPTIEEIRPRIEGGTVPIFIQEKGLSTPTPVTRLSEGTLRYLCLLTLLLDPTPPPVICLEEPEAGLHPHVVSQIAELLIDASQRTQLIVTTHSDALISGLTDCPEAIIICERDDEGTKLRRLEPEQIKPWLDRYAIGDLWRMGEIGGVR